MTSETGRRGRGHDDLLRLLVWGGAGLLLLLPWVAMRFTREVAWDGTDFAVFGAMLAVAGGACELVLRAAIGLLPRLAFGIAIATGFLTVWANLAVGMIGDEGNPANLLFAGVLGVGAVGALLARLRSHGMARAMLATAAAQVVATLLAVAWSGLDIGVVPALCFALPWLVSAALFRKAAREG